MARITSSPAPCSRARYFILPCADAVLAGAGAVHGDGAQRSAGRSTRRRGRPRRRPFGSTRIVRWKLPSPTWPTIGATRPVAAISAAVSVTHSASREIGTQTSVATTLAPGPQHLRRPVGVVPGLPEARALLRLRAPTRIRRRRIPWRSSPNCADCSCDRRFAAVELDEQRRRLGKRELGVERCSARTISASRSSMRATGMPVWMVENRGVAGALHRREGDDAAGDRLRDAVEAERQLGDDAERALRADRAAGSGRSRRRISCARLPVLTTAPSAMTAVRLMTLSRMVP